MTCSLYCIDLLRVDYVDVPFILLPEKPFIGKGQKHCRISKLSSVSYMHLKKPKLL